MKTKDDFVYCSNWKCDDEECLRHHVNQPWNVITRQRRWLPDKNGKCEGVIYDRKK